MEFKLSKAEAAYIAVTMHQEETEQAAVAIENYYAADGNRAAEDEYWRLYKLHKARAARWQALYKQHQSLTITTTTEE